MDCFKGCDGLGRQECPASGGVLWWAGVAGLPVGVGLVGCRPATGLKIQSPRVWFWLLGGRPVWLGRRAQLRG